MVKTKDKTVIKSLGFCGFGQSALPASVDCLDGKVVRIRPLHYDDYLPEENQDDYRYTIEKDGHVFDPSFKSLIPPMALSYKKRTYSKNRVPYPLKRVDWDPNGARNPQNRGISKYERISWDEALDIVSSEIARVCEQYGVRSIYCAGEGHGEGKIYEGGHGCNIMMLTHLGGCTIQARQPDSWEGWYWGAKWMWGMEPIGTNRVMTNCIKDTIENSDAVLFWGCDPDATAWGFGGMFAGRLCNFFTEVGIKQIYICPDFNYGAAAHADKWIPVLPNTDSALQLAIAYTWLAEGTYDKDYIATHSVGFDRFASYVLGEDDGVAKTPKWAEPICGVPSYLIKALARYWAKSKVSIAHVCGGSFIRSAFSHEPGRLEVALLGMQAVGKPGANQWSFSDWGTLGIIESFPVPTSEAVLALRGAFNGWDFSIGDAHIPKTLLPKAIVDPPIDWYGHGICMFPLEDQFGHYAYPIEGDAGIKMIWSDTPCWSTCWNGGNEFFDALRHENLEFFLVQHPWMENDCEYADMILPVSTILEVEDLGGDNMQSGQMSSIFLSEQACDAIGESRSDYQIVCDVAKALERFGGQYKDLHDRYTGGMGREDFYRRGIAWSGAPEEEGLTLERLREEKYWASPIRKGWQDLPAGLIGFHDDPEANPLQTPSGKIEYYSERLAQTWPDDNIRGPFPKWIEKGDGHDDRLTSERAKKYPFLMLSNHSRWRVHAQHGDIPWLREIETCKIKGPDGYLYEPVWLNPVDAEAIGLVDGDICEIYNERGSVLGAVKVTSRVCPNVVYQDHGATVDAIVKGVGGIDRGGANNLICPSAVSSKNAVGEVTSGYLVGVRKADIAALKAKYPEAFERDYCTASGFVFGKYHEESGRDE